MTIWRLSYLPFSYFLDPFAKLKLKVIRLYGTTSSSFYPHIFSSPKSSSNYHPRFCPSIPQPPLRKCEKLWLGKCEKATKTASLYYISVVLEKEVRVKDWSLPKKVVSLRLKMTFAPTFLWLQHSVFILSQEGEIFQDDDDC